MAMYTIESIGRGAALAVVLVVLVTGAITKLRSWNDFVAAVAAYRIVPIGMASTFAVLFVCLELAACGLLLATPLRWLGAALAALVIGIASAGVVVNLCRGRIDIHCGCGGLARATVGAGGLSWWLVARNAILLALVVAAAIPSALGDAPRMHAAGTFTALGAALVMLMLYATASQLVSNHVIMRRRKQ